MSEWQDQALANLDQVAINSAKMFKIADPFPHCVIDNFLDINIVDALVDEFPAESDPIWEVSNQKDIQVKLRSNWQKESDIPPLLSQLFIS